MEFEEKLALYKQDMVRRRIPLRQAMPPMFRWMWQHGVHVPPLLFWSAFLVCPTVSVFFFVPTLLCMMGILWIAYGVFPQVAILLRLVALASLVFGSLMTLVFIFYRNKLDLPSWSEYGLSDDHNIQ